MAKAEPVGQAVTESPLEKQDLKDEIIRGFWRRGGRACVADLANELPATAQELRPVVEELSRSGVVHEVKDSKDHRQYQAPYQTVYELTR